MLAVQQFLATNTLDELATQFGIKVKVYDNFVCLNYDQIESPKTHPITVECRSLKLVKGTWAVASRAFDRFFNYGECPDQYADFDFNKAVITEKVDGSVVPIWYNSIDNRWEISSRSAIFGESTLLDMSKTYRQAVLDALRLTEDEFQAFFTKNANISCTYIFEYIGPDNFIVTPYKDKQLVMLGIRNNFDAEGIRKYRSLDEMIDFVKKMPGSVRMFKVYKLNSFDEIIASLHDFNELEEGYVCWDMKHDLRVKIKSPQYIAVHHLRGEMNITSEGLVNVVVNGEIDEVVVYFPHLKEKLESIKAKVDKIVESISATYDSLSGIESQRDFAKEALKHKFSAVLFSARKHGTTIEHEFSIASADYKKKLIYSTNELIDQKLNN